MDPVAQARHLQENPRSPASPPLRRLARKVLGATVGLAVGGGAAFGISHLGVLRVLEENGIPVDLLAGTSMGSIVALGYAAGIPPSEMIEIAQRIGTRRTTLSALDFTLTKPGLLAGNRLVEIFVPFLTARDFADLTFPCRTVATDIESGETVPICSGPLTLAFRASCSVPVLWAPIRHQGHTLVDGGMTNPVPVDVIEAMGSDLCIAVNVVPSLKKGVDTVLSRLYRKVNRFNPLSYLGGSRELPNMFDITMNSIQQLQHELGAYKSISADVRINPDLSEFTWIEFYRPKELIERGAEATERVLPEIRRVLAEKLALP
jgi:NTE family protein